jgi:hypothetical protein
VVIASPVVPDSTASGSGHYLPSAPSLEDLI